VGASFIQLLGKLLYGTHVRIWVPATDSIGEQLGCRKVLLLVKRGDGHLGLAKVGRDRLPGMKLTHLLAGAGDWLITRASISRRGGTQPLPALVAAVAQEALVLGGAGMADI